MPSKTLQNLKIIAMRATNRHLSHAASYEGDGQALYILYMQRERKAQKRFYNPLEPHGSLRPHFESAAIRAPSWKYDRYVMPHERLRHWQPNRHISEYPNDPNDCKVKTIMVIAAHVVYTASQQRRGRLRSYCSDLRDRALLLFGLVQPVRRLLLLRRQQRVGASLRSGLSFLR